MEFDSQNIEAKHLEEERIELLMESVALGKRRSRDKCRGGGAFF
jgi:hypothetical protein